MAGKTLASTAYTKWHKPRALKDLLSAYIAEDQIIPAVIQRVRGGVLTAVAMNSASENIGNVSEPTGPVIIPPGHWLRPSVSQKSEIQSLWQVGDIRIFFEHDYGFNTPVAITYYDVRFDHVGIENWIAELTPLQSKPDGISHEAISPDEEMSDREMPRVTYDDLAIWHEAYKKIYDGKPGDKLATARKSARGMFPDRFVPRDMVDELRKGGKPGPKK